MPSGVEGWEKVMGVMGGKKGKICVVHRKWEASEHGIRLGIGFKKIEEEKICGRLFFWPYLLSK